MLNLRRKPMKYDVIFFVSTCATFMVRKKTNILGVVWNLGKNWKML